MTPEFISKINLVLSYLPRGSHHHTALSLAMRSGDARAIGGALEAARSVAGMSAIIDSVGLVWQQAVSAEKAA